jgi:hypothetical protein
MLRRIAGYALFILGFLAITFFRHYSGEIIPHPFLFWILGGLFFLAGYLLLRYTPSPKDQAALRQLRQLISELKANGEKISVDLSSCEIREHSYTERRAPQEVTTLALSPLTPKLHHLLNMLEDDTRGTGMSEVCQSVILFPYQNSRTGKTEKFVSPVISKDQISLSFYLDKQKQTTLYVDKTDRTLYYFDLDFLKSE